MGRNKARRGRRSPASPRATAGAPPPRPELPVDEEIDLHGMAVDEALAAAEAALLRHGPGSVVRLVHGHSNRNHDSIRSRIRFALNGVWRKRVARFRTDFHNPGATLVEIS